MKIGTGISTKTFSFWSRRQSILPTFLILISSSCIDRINFNVPYFVNDTQPLVVEGFISDQPGPYTIKVTTGYDLEAKETFRYGISVDKLTISDNIGTVETLTEKSRGLYVTNSIGIRGVIGRVYTIRLEVGDGRIYESKPDTLHAAGTVDSIYFNFRSDPTDVYVNGEGSIKHGFDVFFNASANSEHNFHFLWKFAGTYKVSVPCCTCWVPQYNSEPIISSDQLIREGHFVGVKADYIHITGFTFYDKVYAEVSQFSISRQTFDFWKAILAQKQASNSLFQPVTGKIPSNFVQLEGEKSLLAGIFYASAISSNAIYITKEDIPKGIVIPKLELAPGSPITTPGTGCVYVFPNSTSTKPSFWID